MASASSNAAVEIFNRRFSTLILFSPFYIGQDAPAARGVLLALAKLCAPSNWHRRHLLALDMCVSAAAGDTCACNSIINDFLDANEPLDRSDRDAHLKAKLKLQLQRNSVDIHLAQFAGYAIGAAAPTFSAIVGVAAGPHTPDAASLDSKVIDHLLQYRSDFLAVPFDIAAHVGKMVEEAIDQDVQGLCRLGMFLFCVALACCGLLDQHDCSGWEHELEQMRLKVEEQSRQRAEADAIEARAETGSSRYL
jgi:hypothetical protein